MSPTAAPSPTANDQKTALSREARAMRLKRLRKMTGRSRKSFSEAHHVSQGTLQNWETARFGGLTEKGGHAMVEAFRQDGILVTFEWLMYGAGIAPDFSQNKRKDTPNLEPLVAPTIVDPNALEKEVNYFRALNPGAVTLTINDDAMAPYFKQGEVVAGLKVHERIEQICDRICIVETLNQQLMCRYLRLGTQPGMFHLLSLNPLTQLPQPTLYNVRLRSAAVVLWSRRPH